MSIDITRVGSVAIVTINRPERKNALNMAMRSQFPAIMVELQDDDDVRAIILTGAGGDFAAGADVSEMGTGGVRGNMVKARTLNRMARSAYPHLARSTKGRFVLMTSDYGYHGAAMNTIYAAQKASFRAFIKSLAREWGPAAITVNALSPSAATPPTRVFFDQNPAARDAYIRKFPLQRMGDPRADIAEAAVLLCGDAMGYLTGQTLFLDGGLYPSA